MEFHLTCDFAQIEQTTWIQNDWEDYVELHLHPGEAQWMGRNDRKLQMNRSSLRNNRLKFKTSRNLPIILEEFEEHISKS